MIQGCAGKLKPPIELQHSLKVGFVGKLKPPVGLQHSLKVIIGGHEGEISNGTMKGRSCILLKKRIHHDG